MGLPEQSKTISPLRTSATIGIAALELSFQQRQRQRVLQVLLDRPLERPRAVGRVVARLGQEVARPVGEAQRQPALGQHPVEPAQLDLHDLAQVGPRQAVERHDLVDAVQELRRERLAQRVQRTLRSLRCRSAPDR